MKAYKGFEKQADGSLKCRDFTYEEGKTYEMPEKEIELCKKGFHACKELYQCWLFYPHKSEHIVYHEVECDGNIIESDDADGLLCCSKITIGKEVDSSKLPIFDGCGLFHEGYAVVRKGGKETYVDTNGEYLIKDEGERWFNVCWRFENGIAVVLLDSGELKKLNTKGEYVNLRLKKIRQKMKKTTKNAIVKIMKLSALIFSLLLITAIFFTPVIFLLKSNPFGSVISILLSLAIISVYISICAYFFTKSSVEDEIFEWISNDEKND